MQEGLRKDRARLKGAIGAFGLKTQQCKTDEDLMKLARQVFAIPKEVSSIHRALDFIRSMPTADRLQRGRFASAIIGKRQKQTSPLPISVSSPPRQKSTAKPKNFYRSWEWKKLRYQILCERGPKCECCGAQPIDGVRLVVDHIKSVRHHWHLRLDKANCQVLCNDCNMGKGSDDSTDWGGANIVPFPNINGL